jgi:hypothetical protein
MNEEAEKIIAVTESLLIWDLVATEGIEKPEAIDKLFAERKISEDWYHYSCPLCDLYFWGPFGDACDRCPWPGDKYIEKRCCDDAYWGYERYMAEKQRYNKINRQKLKALGKKVFKRLWYMDI